MPDTGAPWNIPYVAPSDLVRDYPSDSEDLADAIAAGLSAAVNPGIGSNVVQTVKTDTFSASVGVGVLTAITGLSVTITPTTDTSLVLVLYSVSFGQPSVDTTCRTALFRGATQIYLGDGEGSRTRISTGALASGATSVISTTSGMFVDAPATDQAVTYSLQGGHGRGITDNIFVNRSQLDTNSSQVARSVSSILAIEVAV